MFVNRFPKIVNISKIIAFKYLTKKFGFPVSFTHCKIYLYTPPFCGVYINIVIPCVIPRNTHVRPHKSI